jgi:hypothetical protein
MEIISAEHGTLSPLSSWKKRQLDCSAIIWPPPVF